METVYGIVQRVIYKNDSNGYAVISLKMDFNNENLKKYQDYLFTNILKVTCNFTRIPVEGEEMVFTGEFEENKYGLQLKASSYELKGEDTLEGVVTYLSSEYFPGIGKKIAKKIYKTLGKDCLKIIREDKKVLDKIEGLSSEQKDTIYFNLLEGVQSEKDILSFLNMGFTMAMSKKIVMFLTRKEVKMAISNPYFLIDKVEGIGFLKADKIAQNIGIKEDDPMRLKACIVFFLNNYTYQTGNCFVEKDVLYSKSTETLNKVKEVITKEDFDNYLLTLSNEGKIVIDQNGDIYDSSIFYAEEKLASTIVAMIKRDPDFPFTIEEIKKALEKVKKQNNIEYSEKQEEAITKALKENIIIITGGPGTGKTTIVKGIIDTYARLYSKDNVLENVALLAPTGRAGKRLNELTNHPAQTIHKFLGYDGRKFMHSENNPVYAKMIIIDEMSMVDVTLASRLFTSIPLECKIVIVGDVDQIPSVAPGEVLADIIKCKEIDTIRLDKIHRQAQDSSIISLAHSVNNGIIPDNIEEKQHDRNFFNIREEYIIDNIIKIIEQAMKKEQTIQNDIQVLIPMYRGALGIDNVNQVLQDKFNPKNEFDDEINTTRKRFRINDKVIQLENRSEDQIMNGDIGKIISFNYTNKDITGITVKFENGTVEYNAEEYDQLNLAYAISIHKSQGSEFKTVIIPFSKSYRTMLKRRLYYTAITRAKSFLIMLGDIEQFRIAAQSLGMPRKTKLQEKIKNSFGSSDISPYDFM